MLEIPHDIKQVFIQKESLSLLLFPIPPYLIRVARNRSAQGKVKKGF